MKYPFVFYTDPEKIKPFKGLTNAFVVRIAKGSEQDAGLLAHELTHVKRWFLHMLFVGAMCFALSNEFTQAPEVYGTTYLACLCALVGFSFYGIAYRFVGSFRFKEELACYKVQVNTYDYQNEEQKQERIRLFAGFIKNYYDDCTNLSVDEIVALF